MYAQFFGNYLLSQEAVTKDQLIQALQKMSSTQIKLGTLAIHAGYMTASEVDRIIIEQTRQNRRFGELAVSEGYLTEAQATELLKSQQPDFLLLGQALIEDGILSNQQLQDLIIDYQSMNELDEGSYSDETMDSINRMVENFFVVAERPLSSYEVSFFQLLLNNLLRFIGDDFTPVSPSQVREYPTNYCVSQRIDGDFSIRVYLDMPEDVGIEFASRYVGDTFTEFDEYVQSSLEDFLNLHNGLFNVNISNESSVELALEPPQVETEDLLTFDTETFLLPIVFSFGTVYLLFEIYQSND